jgi:pyruvate dehydrogenase E2 component (dihydrolipoamide acetyltransferase)
MAEKIPMLALSPTMETGVITKWLKAEGDPVKSGDLLCEVETDKAVMEYESMADGTLLSIIVPEGGNAAVGEPIAIVGTPGEDITAQPTEQQSAEAAPATSSPPEAKPAAPAPAQAPAPAPAPTPATAESKPAGPVAGTPAPPEAEPAATAPAMPAPAETEPTVPATAPPASAETEPAAPVETMHATINVASGDKVRSTPLARVIAAEHGLDLSTLTGSGPAGRIVKRDVEQALERGKPTAQAPSPAALEDEVIPISPKRRIIADRLSASKFTSPHYYLKVTVRMDQLLKARSGINAERDEKISLNAFLIKLTAAALARHPAVNASWNGDTITRHGRIDIALAVALEDGLLTPVIRNCAPKGILEIDREIRDLVAAARAGKLTPEQYTNATFTISNLGSAGIEEFTAIINPPAAAILAIGTIRQEPVIDGEAIHPAQVMALTLSCDHRLLDGAVAAAFLTDLKNMIQTPLRALL